MFLSDLDREITALKEKGRYRRLRRLSTAQDAVIVIEGREFVNFASNNYLGLANHPEVVAALPPRPPDMESGPAPPASSAATWIFTRSWRRPWRGSKGRRHA